MKFLLDSPFVYLAFQSLIGAKGARKKCLDEYIRATAGQRILDVGCGPGFVLDYLPPVDYVGFDINERYVRYAQAKYGDRGTFHCRYLDFDNAEMLGKFDWVLLNGVVHHIDDAGVRVLFQILAGCLKPDGALLTLDGCYQDIMSPISHFMLDHDRGKHIRTQEQYKQLACERFTDVSLYPRKDLFGIPYDALVLVCRQPQEFL
jgi:SAM-dependent methyltransferase